MTSAIDEKTGCPRCHGVVFEAEKVVAGEHVWFHKSCFNCQICHTRLDSMRCAIGRNGDAYCGSCYKEQLRLENNATNMAKARIVISAQEGDPHACPRCQGKVYEAEKMIAGDRWYHNHCFTCADCNHQLEYQNSMSGPNGDIFCKTCYVRSYFTGGRNHYGDSRQLPLAQNDKEACLKCNKNVYEMDKILTK